MSKKSYSIHWENDEPVSFEVDGVLYESLDQVPEDADREKLEAMLDGSLEQKFEKEFENFDKDFEKAAGENKKSADSMQRIVTGVFSGVAVLMLLIALLSSFGSFSKINREESAPGRVVEVVMERDYVNEEDRIIEEYYYPVVEFTALDGRWRSVKMNEGSSSPYYEAGDEVNVRYDPEHPLDARIDSLGSYVLMFILPGITGILGLGFLGAVLMVRKFMPLEKTDEVV